MFSVGYTHKNTRPKRSVSSRTISDYSPFGVLLPERSVNTADFRYGFQGKEGDSEVKGKGNSYDFVSRMYDCRIGKFLSLDPQRSKTPNTGPYVFVENSPVALIDPSGESGILIIDKENKRVVIHSHITFYGKMDKGGEKDFVYNEVRQAQKMWNDANGKITIDDVEYDVQFVITADYNPNITAADMANNVDFSQNYMLLGSSYSQNVPGGVDCIPSDELSTGNSGFIDPAHPKFRSGQTVTHEIGHIFGLLHGLVNDNVTIDGRDLKMVLGNPGIMAVAGQPVESQWALDPSSNSIPIFNAGENPHWENTLDINKREVTKENVSEIGTKINESKNQHGNMTIGNLTNEYHGKENKK